MQGVRGYHQQPGETRRTQNWIGPSGSTILSAIYIPPPHIEAEQALGELEKFIHASDHLPLLIRRKQREKLWLSERIIDN